MDNQYHDNFYDCRINNCACYKPIDYFDTSNNAHIYRATNNATTTCNGASTTHNNASPTRDDA
jgi:hypothetical protein